MRSRIKTGFLRCLHVNNVLINLGGGLRRSALARRNICPLRRKMSLRSSILSQELLLGLEKAFEDRLRRSSFP
ncbi:hypothetical protein, partial [Desulfosporosinus burensis]